MQITFEDAMKGASPFTIAPNRSTENRGFFTHSRVDRRSLPDDWYAYDIRRSEFGGIPYIENAVFEDFDGTFLTQEPIKLNDYGRKALTCGYYFNEK